MRRPPRSGQAKNREEEAAEGMREILGTQGWKGVVLDVVYSLLGSATVALAVAVFTVPNDIAPGGVSGLATALAYVSPVSVGVWTLLLNVPLLLTAWRLLGPRALAMTLLATVLLSVFIDLFAALLPGYTNNVLLAAVAGGVLSGLDKKKAASFSFMMSAPAILGSLIMEGKDALEAGDFAYISLVPTITGIIVAAAAGYFALRFMLKIIAKVPLSAFAVYLAILGIVFLALQLSGSSLVPAFAPSPAPVG